MPPPPCAVARAVAVAREWLEGPAAAGRLFDALAAAVLHDDSVLLDWLVAGAPCGAALRWNARTDGAVGVQARRASSSTSCSP